MVRHEEITWRLTPRARSENAQQGRVASRLILPRFGFFYAQWKEVIELMQGTSTDMAKKHQDKKISEIMQSMTCEKDFHCCRSDSGGTHYTKDITGIHSIVECLDQSGTYCKFKMPFSDRYNLCTCPVRVHITKHAVIGKTV